MSRRPHPTAFRALVLGASLAAALATACARPASAQEKRSSLWDPAGSASVVAPVDETIKKTGQLLDGMGYTVTNRAADYILIDSGGISLALESSTNGRVLYGTIYVNIPKDKVGLIPYEKLMVYNGHSLTHFGIDKYADDRTQIVLIDHISATEMTPKTLKELIDDVSSDAGKHLDLIDPANWKSSLPEFSNK